MSPSAPEITKEIAGFLATKKVAIKGPITIESDISEAEIPIYSPLFSGAALAIIPP